MDCLSDKKNKDLDFNHAVQLDRSIWWVGHYLPDDPFQCHVYLIEDGENSVLIDPGSKLTFEKTLEKIEEIIPFSHIKYFIAHHQDPDITGALLQMDDLITRPDAVVLSHWRTNALLKHYGLKIPLECVEERGWKLSLPHRELKFVFTPYLHFSGAFTTYDTESRILFSSDIFGGFTSGWSLVARDKSYFESMRLFHEHYMPSKEILKHSIRKFEKLDLSCIAPQHGSIIPKPLVKYMIDRLKNLECGIFLTARSTTDVYRISELNRLLKDSLEILVLKRDFLEIRNALQKTIKKLLPVKKLDFFVRDHSGEIINLCNDCEPDDVSIQNTLLNISMIGLSRKKWQKLFGDKFFIMDGTLLLLPLFSTETKSVISLSLMNLKSRITMDEELEGVIAHMVLPLSVAVEREIILRNIKMDKQRFYEQAIRDKLTDLYTRLYMEEAVKRLMRIHDRNARSPFAVIMFDIDHFKRVNDSYGHGAGDVVLSSIAEIILKHTREEDINVRYGGEEFVSFIVAPEYEVAQEIAERIRDHVEMLRYGDVSDTLRVTISGGIAFRKQGESLKEIIERADKALYLAKAAGRNCIRIDSEFLSEGV